MTATRNRWKNSPFLAGVPIPYRARFTKAECDKLQKGLVPAAMEDKWFVFFESPYLYFHRSWTGQPVYRLKIESRDDDAVVNEALWEISLAEGIPDQVPYQAKLLDFLISNLLLGMRKPFPQPGGLVSPPGVLQHHVAGTGYVERTVDESAKASPLPESPVRPWWRFWQ